MTYTLSLASARKILKLLHGESVPSSMFPAALAEVLLDEGLLVVSSRGSRKSYRINDVKGCRVYLSQHYSLQGSLEQWVELKSREENASRAEQVLTLGNSKFRHTRTFKGFLLNSYVPIEATLCEEPFLIHPAQGTSLFMENYECFRIPEDVMVIGMENGENFQNIRAQRYLFEKMKVLFVSRYPQSKDLRTWLQMIPNRYIHFGDFDLAGIHIFLQEYYAFLGERAQFFVPDDLESRLKEGNQQLYDDQYALYKDMKVTDARLQTLVRMIHRYKRGYEQEGYIKLL